MIKIGMVTHVGEGPVSRGQLCRSPYSFT